MHLDSILFKTAAWEVHTVHMDKWMGRVWMEGRSWDTGKEGGGSERRARGVSLLWKAKTAAVLKLQCSATVPQGCVCFCVCVCISVCLCRESRDRGQYRAEMEREGGGEGRDRRGDMMIFAW